MDILIQGAPQYLGSGSVKSMKLIPSQRSLEECFTQHCWGYTCSVGPSSRCRSHLDMVLDTLLRFLSVLEQETRPDDLQRPLPTLTILWVTLLCFSQHRTPVESTSDRYVLLPLYRKHQDRKVPGTFLGRPLPSTWGCTNYRCSQRCRSHVPLQERVTAWNLAEDLQEIKKGLPLLILPLEGS